MDAANITLVLVIVTALAFDFTNGFHDTANAMAASISTGALKPKVAVGLSAILNLVGAFLSVQVALTVTNAVINLQTKDGAPNPELLADGGEAVLLIILAGLAGGILWNLFTWLLGLPSSSSHALLGGLTGAGAAGLGWAGVKWNGDGTKLDGVVGKILLPSLISPIIALTVAFTGCWLVHKVTQSVMHRLEERYFRYGQVGSASLVSIAHGTNDAQKTMGVMTLALIASGHWTSTTSIPVWVKFSAATAIAARHLPRRLADHPHPGQGAGRHHPAPGHVERRLHRGRAALREPPRVRALHDARGDRLGARWRPRPRHAGALVDRRPDGHRLGDHLPHRRPHGRADVVDRRHHRRRCRRHRRVPDPQRRLVLDLPQLAPGARGRAQRQRHLGTPGGGHLAGLRARAAGAPRRGTGAAGARPAETPEPTETKTH